MQTNNAEDENQRQNEHNHGVDLKTSRFVGVELYIRLSVNHIHHVSRKHPSSPPPYLRLIGSEQVR